MIMVIHEILGFFAGPTVIFECTACWCFIGYLGSEILPSGDCVLYMCPDSSNPHKHMVVLCHDIHQRRIRRHLFSGFRLRGRCHRRKRKKCCLRPREFLQSVKKKLKCILFIQCFLRFHIVKCIMMTFFL